MRHFFLSSFLWLLMTPSALATYGLQVIPFGVDNLPTSATTVYTMVEGNSSTNATATNRMVRQGPAGRYCQLWVVVDTAPGSGNSHAFTLQLAAADTSLTCTISNSDTTCQTSLGVAAAAANNVGLEITSTGTPAATNAKVILLFRPTTEGQTQWGGSTRTTNVSDVADNYISPIGHTISATESDTQIVMPTSGSFSAIRVEISGVPGAGDSYLFTLRVNGVDDATLQCTVTAAGTACADATGTVSVVSGDLISVECDPNNSPTARTAKVGLTFSPTRAGDFVLGHVSADTILPTTTQYTVLYGTENFTNVETSSDQPGYPLIVQNIYVDLSANLDASTSVDFVLRANTDSLDTRCTVPSGDDQCSAARASRVNLFDAIGTRYIPNNSPNAPTASISYLATVGDAFLDASTIDAASLQ